ncbi:MAG: hypothetical protein HGA47_10540 [Zoogloea sp.]|nr:hypothetical protein [Zoogloea sp.]
MTVGLVLLALCLPAWMVDRPAFLAAWLAGWSFCAGVVMGGLANVWLHNLTGGAWGDAIRARLLATGRLMPWLALLFLPVPLGMGQLYPWAAPDGHWAAGLAFTAGTNVFLSQTQWIADINVNAGAASYEAGGWGIFSLSFATVDYGTINGTRRDPSTSAGFVETGNV